MPATVRRRLYLMRHGAVDYFDAAGRPLRAESVALNDAGRRQADAAGALFGAAGVRFDRVLASGLPRTVQTAERVLAAAGLALPVEQEPALQEIRGGRLADLAPQEVEAAFLAACRPGAEVEGLRFLGGESVGELLDRALPAFARWRERTDWRCMLMVLHGGVNRAILATLLAGRRAFFGGLEQQPGCINVIDLGGGADAVVRAVNLAPMQWLHEDECLTTMEALLAQYRPRSAGRA